MHFLRRHWPLVLLFLAWLPLAVTLALGVPTPERAQEMSSMWQSLAEQGKEGLKYLDEQEQRKLKEDIEKLSDSKSMLKQWRKHWAISVLVLLAGWGSVVLAIRRIKGWKFSLIIASAAYIFFVSDFPLMHALHWETWQAWWMMARSYPFWGIPALYHDVAFPLFHVVLIIGLVVSIALSRRRVG